MQCAQPTYLGVSMTSVTLWMARGSMVPSGSCPRKANWQPGTWGSCAVSCRPTSNRHHSAGCAEEPNKPLASALRLQTSRVLHCPS